MKKQLLILLVFITYNAFAQCIDPVITDFECSGPSHGSYPGNLTTVTNPNSSGINTSANVGEYTDDGTNAWDALIFDYGTAIDLTTNNILKVKLYTPTSIQILAKIEGGTGSVHEIRSPFSTGIGPVNTWIEFVYDFSAYSNNSTGGDANTKLVLFINGGQTGGTPADVYHIDDIQWTSNVLSIEEEAINANIRVYPNPTQDIINIDSKEIIDSYEIMEVTGKVVLKEKLESSLKTIDISNLKPGLYFFRIKSGDKQSAVKVLKQ